MINAVCFSSVYCSTALLLSDSLADLYNRSIMVQMYGTLPRFNSFVSKILTDHAVAAK